MRQSSMNPGLIFAGLVAIAAGTLIFILMVLDVSRPASSAAPFGGGAPGALAADAPPSRIWSVAGGLALAAGFALVGVGMNRWTGGRRQRG